jgi:hypothetical protein
MSLHCLLARVLYKHRWHTGPVIIKGDKWTCKACGECWLFESPSASDNYDLGFYG